MQKIVTSLTNPDIKAVGKLRNRRERERTGLTIIEGQRECLRAIHAKVPLKQIFIEQNVLKNSLSSLIKSNIQKLNIPIIQTTDRVFSKIAYGDRHEGILSVAEPILCTLDQLPQRKNGIYVVVEGIEKPGNLGAILRTCDGVGVDGVFLCDGRTDLFNPNVIRASVSTVFTVPTVIVPKEELYTYLKSKDVKIVSTQPSAKTVYTQAQFKSSLAVIVGSEQKGLTDFWLKHADEKVRIPMQGKGDSLNVSTATAVLLYEILRQKGE